jgi:hypothetical protein
LARATLRNTAALPGVEIPAVEIPAVETTARHTETARSHLPS